MLKYGLNIGIFLAFIIFFNVAQAQAQAQAQEVDQFVQPVLQINVNTAEVEDLMQLPGIGKAKALAIVRSRESEGLFFDIQELGRVKGIGKGLINKIQAHVVLE
ncbi:ComEA family DNA-binding protein [Pseudoalteromonas luteoviolacea]|uniref:Helix-hairpin-helix DNA-binding motif class 1 domain-containing protein n=1 Tax=Pseudoalteromonas luteoviolacea S4054 TaxID=1129367 RepID=A0A0F6AH09_9GAMM|nr:helix-hairpin-helix domain-containing protein [Pseudoalteromonas luteoviolacea]AOT09214.1 hypothetical protein S4054249_15775 [Pseudoalteromonas luteoviolacea]AOT14126.1 hypothetical protein S40542_15745 [Pseudoalteromonas luteoviolacea]AOT19042.1 hypothetical protein S4054_15750 [Pseudoalteromonas luteoviolacea]KKE85081.1 hypothetical protein N479_06500 [Pseudoalteromonas luteoviolacea S4054]KZN70199.1 hypothetical protein N481_01610 [Pseudoalteromonas luteoviolacea S4047-1]